MGKNVRWKPATRRATLARPAGSGISRPLILGSQYHSAPRSGNTAPPIST